MSAGGDATLSSEQASGDLLSASRALERAWFGALLSATTMVILTLPLVIGAWWLRTPLIIVALLLTGVAVYNLTRLWPRIPPRRGAELTLLETEHLRDWLGRGPHDDGFARVRVVASPMVSLDQSELVLGLPLLAVLGPEEVRGLVSHSVAVTEVERRPSIRRAMWIARGEVGRGLVGRQGRDSWVSRTLTGRVTERSNSLWHALDGWVSACRWEADVAGGERAGALAARDLVVEGWELLVEEWLGPAVAGNCWHPQPFSGLSDFMCAADSSGWLDRPLSVGPTAFAAVPGLAEREAEVATDLLGELRADLFEPVSWQGHADAVTIPAWRAMIAEVLTAGRRASGEPVPATANAVLDLLEAGWGPILAEETAASRGIDPDAADPGAWERWSVGFQERLLTALLGVAALDGRQVEPCWSWPQGVSLVAAEGWTLPVVALVNDVLELIADRGLRPAYAELRSAFAELGLDPDEPLWLGHGQAPAPERPRGAFVAYQGLGFRHVVVTDRAVHVFRRTWWQGMREYYAMRSRGHDELHSRMLAVLQGDVSDQVACFDGPAVARARFGPLMGGGWWRLALDDDARRVTLRGNGDGRVEEAIVADLLGERLVTTWLHWPRPVQLVRNVLGWLALGLGGFGLLLALVFVVMRPHGMPLSVPLLIASVSLAVYAVAMLPDLVLGLALRVRRPRLPDPQVLARSA